MIIIMNPYLGQITIFAGNFAPEGWAYCDGRLMSIDQNDVLFSILGTQYGGDGRRTFALPKIEASLTESSGKYIICTAFRNNFPPRD